MYASLRAIEANILISSKMYLIQQLESTFIEILQIYMSTMSVMQVMNLQTHNLLIWKGEYYTLINELKK